MGHVHSPCGTAVPLSAIPSLMVPSLFSAVVAVAALALSHTQHDTTQHRWWMELGILCCGRFTLCAGPQHAVQRMEPNNSLGCKPDQWGRLLASHQRQRYARKSLRSCSLIYFVLCCCCCSLLWCACACVILQQTTTTN